MIHAHKRLGPEQYRTTLGPQSARAHMEFQEDLQQFS